jgi:DNA-binding ferritin-like protein
MLEIAVSFRAMQLFAHHAHNLCARLAFHQDHEFFAEAYGFAEKSYDNIIERIIGTKGEEGLDIKNILKGVYSKLDKAPSIGVKENKIFYMFLLEQFKNANKELNDLCKKPEISEGTRQLLGGIADEVEVFVYKIQQRIK